MQPVQPIKEETIQEEETQTEVSSEGESLKTINESMSILDNSLNLDPDYTSNNAFLDRKPGQTK